MGVPGRQEGDEHDTQTSGHMEGVPKRKKGRIHTFYRLNIFGALANSHGQDSKKDKAALNREARIYPNQGTARQGRTVGIYL